MTLPVHELLKDEHKTLRDATLTLRNHQTDEFRQVIFRLHEQFVLHIDNIKLAIMRIRDTSLNFNEQLSMSELSLAKISQLLQTIEDAWDRSADDLKMKTALTLDELEQFLEYEATYIWPVLAPSVPEPGLDEAR